jgi:hypothetical protein
MEVPIMLASATRLTDSRGAEPLFVFCIVEVSSLGRAPTWRC